MKVLLINGSPKKEGCTYTALKEVADELEKMCIRDRHHTDRGQKGGVQRIVVRNKETEKSR